MVTPDHESDSYARLRQSLTVDTLRLGEEVVEFPMLLMEVGEHCAVAVARQDIAANDLKTAMAEAADQLRSAVGENGKAPSEARVTAGLAKHKKVVAATRELEGAKLDRALWAALVDAVKAKQSAVKQTTDMTLAGYMSTGSAYDSRKKELNDAPHRRARTIDQDGEAQERPRFRARS